MIKPVDLISFKFVKICCEIVLECWILFKQFLGNDIDTHRYTAPKALPPPKVPRSRIIECNSRVWIRFENLAE
jgi:hypothetical protein